MAMISNYGKGSLPWINTPDLMYGLKKLGTIISMEVVVNYMHMTEDLMLTLHTGEVVSARITHTIEDHALYGCSSLEEWQTTLLDVVSNGLLGFGQPSPGWRLCLGGPRNGELIKHTGLAPLHCAPLTPVQVKFGSFQPINEKAFVHCYTLESLGIDVKDHPPVYSRVLCHESVPKGQVLQMFKDCLTEFPAIRLYSAYYPFWRHRNEW